MIWGFFIPPELTQPADRAMFVLVGGVHLIRFLLAVCENASTNANSAIFVQLFHDLQTFN